MSDMFLGASTDSVLGEEFLTWAWYHGENYNGLLKTYDQDQAYHINLEQRIVVRGGEGESLETASVSGSMSLLREARLGLVTGKKVVRALLKIEKEELTWYTTLKAEDFSVNGLKTPAIAKDDDGDPDNDATFLEKVYLIETCIDLLDDAYKHFLEIRLNSKAWQEEVKQITKWISSENK